ncbi:MAG: amidase [Proteobacteria bacterium]|nr:amidase [Pseudomonadota bacterium]
MDRFTLEKLINLYKENKASVSEVVEDCLKSIDEKDSEINCFWHVDKEQAIHRAKELDKQASQFSAQLPLFGVPVAYKDLFETAGIKTTAGSSFLKNYVPEQNAFVVDLFQQAGVVSLGKVAMHEWAMGCIGDNAFYGACGNPHDPDYICGGSSSGSAAAVAAGLCFLSLGTDTGGSIRIPAACCGVVGIKPSNGLISNRGVIPLSWNLDHVGPLANNVFDIAMALNVLSIHDPLDPYSKKISGEDYTKDIRAGVKGWKIALAGGNYFNDSEVVAEETIHAIKRAAKAYESLGAIVEIVDCESLKEARELSRQHLAADALAFHHDRINTDPTGFGEDVLSRLINDPPKTVTDYANLKHRQMILKREYDSLLEKYDCLILPTTPFAAVDRNEVEELAKARKNLTRFTAPFNFLDLPAISIPCGFNYEGMFIGLQIVSARYQESKILRAAYAFEETYVDY